MSCLVLWFVACRTLVCPASLLCTTMPFAITAQCHNAIPCHLLQRHLPGPLCKPIVKHHHAPSACADKGRLYLCTSCALHTSSQCWVLWCRRQTRRYQAGCRAWGPVLTPLEAASAVEAATALVDRTSGGIMVAIVSSPTLCVSDSTFWAVQLVHGKSLKFWCYVLGCSVGVGNLHKCAFHSIQLASLWYFNALCICA